MCNFGLLVSGQKKKKQTHSHTHTHTLTSRGSVITDYAESMYTRCKKKAPIIHGRWDRGGSFDDTGNICLFFCFYEIKDLFVNLISSGNISIRYSIQIYTEN